MTTPQTPETPELGSADQEPETDEGILRSAHDTARKIGATAETALQAAAVHTVDRFGVVMTPKEVQEARASHSD